MTKTRKTFNSFPFILALLMIGCPAQARYFHDSGSIDGKLGDRSSSQVTVKFEILHGAISRPMGQIIESPRD